MYLVFDIETVPDTVSGRRWLHLDDTTDDRHVAEAMWEATSFLKPGFHRVVAIAAALVDEQGRLRRLGAVGGPDDGEPALIDNFFSVIRDLKPTLVGWNTSGFDVPVLLYRAMRHHIAVPDFYRMGEPYHGYRKRYDETLHLDLMDLLSGYGASTRMRLDEVAAVLGVPGKLGVGGEDVWDLWLSGDRVGIRNYCETDVLTTAMVFAAYAFHRGWFEAQELETFHASAQAFLALGEGPHWTRFRKAWEGQDLFGV